MPALTLFARLYSDSQLPMLMKDLELGLKGLKVDVKACGTVPRNRVRVTVSGEDENAAVHYLEEKAGLCIERLENLRKFMEVRGRVVGIAKKQDELMIDVGVFSPDVVDAVIPLQRLQAQLVDGRKLALKKIVDLFGLCENLPLNVKITEVDTKSRLIEAELSWRQQTDYLDWTRSLLDRLLILGVSFSEVEMVLKRHVRDIIKIEPMGMLEHAAICKLDTDARGLISNIGRQLRNATFTVFSPKRILELLGTDYADLPLVAK